MIKIYIVDKSNLKPRKNDLVYYVIAENNSF